MYVKYDGKLFKVLSVRQDIVYCEDNIKLLLDNCEIIDDLPAKHTGHDWLTKSKRQWDDLLQTHYITMECSLCEKRLNVFDTFKHLHFYDECPTKLTIIKRKGSK